MEMVSKKKKRNKDGCSRGLEAELMEEQHLPLEFVLDEIMCWLSVKPLVRFRSVCKIFNSVITCDPKFAILQQKNSVAIRSCSHDRQRIMVWDLRDCSAAFFLKRKSRAVFSLERINTCPMKGNESFKVVASCDGLVCILNIMTNSIIFWNPLTGETKIVSYPPEGISLSYDFCSYGLGYDSSSDDYKLVWIMIGSLQPNEGGVYSLRTNSWRRIPYFPTNNVMRFQKPSVFINGALYWIVVDIPCLTYKVVSFCLQREKYSLFNVPFLDLKSSYYTGIQVMGNKLAIYCISVKGSLFRLFFLNRDNSESWTEHTVTIPKGRKFFKPFCLLEDDGEVLFEGRASELGFYRLSDDTFRYSHIIGLPEIFEVITFSESLISPNTYTGSKTGKISGMETKEGTAMKNLA